MRFDLIHGLPHHSPRAEPALEGGFEFWRTDAPIHRAEAAKLVAVASSAIPCQPLVRSLPVPLGVRRHPVPGVNRRVCIQRRNGLQLRPLT